MEIACFSWRTLSKIVLQFPRIQARFDRSVGAAGRGAGRGDLWRAAAQAGGLKADDAEVKVELLTENMPEEAPVEAGGKQATDDNDDVGWEADAPAAVGDASEWDAGGDDDEWE